MTQKINHKLFIKLIIVYLCIAQIVQGKNIKIKKTTKIHGKKQHTLTLSKNPIKELNPEFSFENRKKFIEKEYESFKQKSKENVPINIEDAIKLENKKENKKTNESEQKVKDNSFSNSSETNNEKSDNNYYIFGGGIVSIALVGVGFLNVYQRNRNSIFSLSKEELEALDKNTKLNNSYTSLTEEEKRFLHKINARKHITKKRFDELSEKEILEIRKKNGWVDSDDEDCQLRRRKIDKRLSSNVKINTSSVIAPRRISLNVKLDKDNLLSKSAYRRSYDDINKLRKSNSINSNNVITSQSDKIILNPLKDTKRKRLSIDTSNIVMPPIKMVCTIVKNYKPVRPDELKLHLGDKVEIINVFKDGWAIGKNISNDENGNKLGYFPLAHASEPEVFDENINEFMIPSPLTPPVNRSFSNMSYQHSKLAALPFSNLITNTNVKKASSKSKNRQVSMIAVSSSSSILTQEPVSMTNSAVSSPSIININNNINIFQNNNINDTSNNININININSNDNQNCINNNITISSDKENENTPIINNNSLFIASSTTPSSYLSTNNLNRTSLLDPQSIKYILNDMLEDEKINNKSTSENDLPCHSQEVFDFLRGNVYNSEVPMEERDYYKKCLERLRMSKLLNMELQKKLI
ncbi:hypothetical protein PIROE2DRAFT_69613 [Piromyces sp. E2]|nr:hypothetical protein PIROE2DRAFT_69613 [Piromyces sp. E2]|eukprot:OUM61419.1 hypothetical protein PIROE2DRAFT_69613 [Piromyces sp. E2]